MAENRRERKLEDNRSNSLSLHIFFSRFNFMMPLFRL